MSPFKSKKQQAWMFSNKPKMAKEWADETPNIKSLPTTVSTKGSYNKIRSFMKKKKSKASGSF